MISMYMCSFYLFVRLSCSSTFKDESSWHKIEKSRAKIQKQGFCPLLFTTVLWGLKECLAHCKPSMKNCWMNEYCSKLIGKKSKYSGKLLAFPSSQKSFNIFFPFRRWYLPPKASLAMGITPWETAKASAEMTGNSAQRPASQLVLEPSF